ncbi:hypothetical protein BUALT_Bualt19G0005200 [Buddleja alternifolia]|uniref:Protein kinase domain-containing protein n=1 Tax=Buddleja alternifolia TaxID=168488 RepID=A0AAV6W473_9LAMI|nr:hypothetical protein BUALT_Bualt19G0005200 [Buddleja alternifolia]
MEHSSMKITRNETGKNVRTKHSNVISSRSSYSAFNLRQWLESKASYVRMINKLRLFRHIVEIVDIAHNQGLVLLDLRPSSFIVLETGDVKYIGSLLDIENSFCVKKQKVEEDIKHETRFVSRFVSDKGCDEIICYDPDMETKLYACPKAEKGLTIEDLLSFNVYCLGLLLFEFLCGFESLEARSAAMLDLQRRILPPSFLSESPKEAAFCLWLLHPEPSSRPTTTDILQSELVFGSEVDDSDSDILHHFLLSLLKHKQNKASDLSESLEFLEADINEVEKIHDPRKNNSSKDHKTNVLREKLLKNMNQLENAYFSERSRVPLTETPDMDRSDRDILRNRDRLPIREERCTDRVGTCFDGICKFARYNKFEVCGMLRNHDILKMSNNIVCSLSFDRDEEYIAAAGNSKKIKIFEFGSFLNDSVEVQYPVVEMSNKSKFSCVCWNKYIKNYLASADYDGLVQMWDASTGQGFARYTEHQNRAWSVDISQVDPTKFASGSDDGTTRIWSISERNSVGTICNQANVCCVQFSAFSSHLLAFGSSDYRIYFYDLRHTKIPWCTLDGHGKAVSYVRFLDPETLVSASTDNTLKLWDLNKTSLEGLSANACSLTFSGHTNEKNFVGLAVLDGYIACGSETNEVYAYYRSLPMPITSHKFRSIDPISGYEISDSDEHFVSSVCWRRKSEMVVAANSSGSIKVLRLV